MAVAVGDGCRSGDLLPHRGGRWADESWAARYDSGMGMAGAVGDGCRSGNLLPHRGGRWADESWAARYGSEIGVAVGDENGSWDLPPPRRDDHQADADLPPPPRRDGPAIRHTRHEHAYPPPPPPRCQSLPYAQAAVRHVDSTRAHCCALARLILGEEGVGTWVARLSPGEGLGMGEGLGTGARLLALHLVGCCGRVGPMLGGRGWGCRRRGLRGEIGCCPLFVLVLVLGLGEMLIMLRVRDGMGWDG